MSASISLQEYPEASSAKRITEFLTSEILFHSFLLVPGTKVIKCRCLQSFLIRAVHSNKPSEQRVGLYARSSIETRYQILLTINYCVEPPALGIQ
jgi:hypothetical protein